MSGNSKHELRTWLGECPIDFENPAVCEIIPCGHFVSIETARNYGRLIRRGDRSANPHRCPMCRQPWTQIKCLSVEKTHEKIQTQLRENTQHIPNGPLRVWFQEILHFFTTRNVIDDELKQLIGQCLVDSFIVRTQQTSSKSAGASKSSINRGDVIHLTNDQTKIIKLIKCIQKAVSDWTKTNFGSREKAIEDNMRLSPEAFEDSPLKWLLTESHDLGNMAIEQAKTITLPKRTQTIHTESIFTRLRRSLGMVATEAPTQIPAEITTVVLSTAVLIGSARMYRAVDYSVCDGLDTTPIPGPDVPTRGRWVNFPVCTSSFDQQYCCDPKGTSTGAGACGTDSYHTSNKPNVYNGPEIDYSQRRAMEPGGDYDCDAFGNSGLPGCYANSLGNAFACALTGDEECDLPGGYAWALADGATFEVTETGPGPDLPSQHAQCSDKLSSQETMALGAAVVSMGVLLYGLYSACTNFRAPRQNRVNLVGDDTLVIDSAGNEHRGGYKKRKRKTKKRKGGKKKTLKRRNKKTRRKRKMRRKSRKKTRHRR